MRLIHLIDDRPCGPPSTTLALLSGSLGRLGEIEQRVLLIGGPGLDAAARRVGVSGAMRTGGPPGVPVLAWPRVRRMTRGDGPLDVVHCWSVGCLVLATLAWPGVPRVLTLTETPSVGSIRWLRALMHERSSGVTVLTISSTIRRGLLTRGIVESKVHVLRPGIDMGRVQHGARAGLRERWGVDSEDCRVIALLSDPAAASDALAAGLVLELANHSPNHIQATPQLRLLVHPGQRHRLRAQRAAEHTGHGGRIIQEPGIREPWSVLPGCDIALSIGPDAGGLSLIWAMSANVPIVGDATYAVSEIVEDRHSALLATPGSTKHLARRIGQLMADPQLAWKLRDTARHEAYSFFSRQQYCRSLAGVYEQVTAGRAIQIPELEVTGGLRFAGRA